MIFEFCLVFTFQYLANIQNEPLTMIKKTILLHTSLQCAVPHASGLGRELAMWNIFFRLSSANKSLIFGPLTNISVSLSTILIGSLMKDWLNCNVFVVTFVSEMWLYKELWKWLKCYSISHFSLTRVSLHRYMQVFAYFQIH